MAVEIQAVVLMQMQALAEVFEKLESTTRRTEMVRDLAVLFRAMPPEDIPHVIYLCQGRLLPPFEPLEFGVGERMLLKAEALAANKPAEQIEDAFHQLGDLGSVAARFLDRRQGTMKVDAVYDRLLQVAKASGAGSATRKVELLTGLLRDLPGDQAKYVVRIVQGRLRLGIGDPTILDALSVAVSGSTKLRPMLENAYNVCSDLGLVGETLFAEGIKALEAFEPAPGRPVRPMLAERLASPQEIIAKIGPCIAEPKYDGFRLQVHKHGNAIRIFSRRIEDLTGMFPDIVSAARTQIAADRAIVEGEAIAYNPETGEFASFQETVHRKRKYEIEEMSARYPLRLFLFDIMYGSGHGSIELPLTERRALLEKTTISGADMPITLTEYMLARDAGELDHYFQEMVERGLEGIVAKNPAAGYHAGARDFNWVKLKRGYQAKLADTVDVVLVGYLLGKGNRARFGIGSLLAAVYDKKHDRFRTVAKIGSGLSEEKWAQIKALLDGVRSSHKPPRVDSDLVPDVWANPAYVVEVQADEITRSPVHTTGKHGDKPGYALRFPRVINWLREDKAPEDATTEQEILELYHIQKRVQKR